MLRASLRHLAATAGLILAAQPAARADDGPPPVPATRVDLKQTLEASKRNKPRLPLPPPSEADHAKMADAKRTGADWSVYNNGRTRKFYLPAELAQVSSLRGDDPVMSLGHRFQTMLFWIVSRANNCTHCMGHQESKLAAFGMTDDQVAALDGDWSESSPQERAAFTLTRKLTFEPDRLIPADIAAARRVFTDSQVLQIVHAVGGFNAMNRSTGALRIPQEEHRVYPTPTVERYLAPVSRQAPLDSSATGGLARARSAHRAPLESRAEVEAILSASRTRTPTLPLVDDAQARAVLGGDRSSEPLEAWVRLLAPFPKAGPARIALHEASATKGELDPVRRGQIARVAARHDRAWYARDPSSGPIAPDAFAEVQERLEAQRNRQPRVSIPTWDEFHAAPPESPDPRGRPPQIRWSLLVSGRQPRLGPAGIQCLRLFEAEAKRDRVFEESLFWVVTRSLRCFDCMGHREMLPEGAGLDRSAIAARTARLAEGVGPASRPPSVPHSASPASAPRPRASSTRPTSRRSTTGSAPSGRSTSSGGRAVAGS